MPERGEGVLRSAIAWGIQTVRGPILCSTPFGRGEGRGGVMDVGLRTNHSEDAAVGL